MSLSNQAFFITIVLMLLFVGIGSIFIAAQRRNQPERSDRLD
jgi:hypothetical protein